MVNDERQKCLICNKPSHGIKCRKCFEKKGITRDAQRKANKKYITKMILQKKTKI